MNSDDRFPQNPPPAHPPLQPPVNPYVVAQPAPTPPRPGWSWRSSIVGAVAGGVLAASVAVPVTWALTHEDAPAGSTDQVAPVQPGQPDNQDALPQPPGGDPFGGSTSDREDTGATEATADQSAGVVLIDTRTTAGQAAGTGLVIDSSGLVLTNYHVVEGSTEVSVTVASTGTTYDATVIGHDQTADIALLQLDDASDLTTVDLDDDGDPGVSDDVTAVGNADGQGFLSASTGSVIALDQSIDTQSEGPVAGEHLTGLIQTDAYVVGGYSGGALLDDEGEVVGMTTAASSGGAAESYAVPIETALDVAEQIEDGQESGDVRIGPAAYLGISVSTENGGVQVGQVQADGPAADAGVEAGATITRLGDTTITSLDVLRRALATYEPGDSAVLRWTDASGQTHRATVELAESPVN